MSEGWVRRSRAVSSSGFILLAQAGGLNSPHTNLHTPPNCLNSPQCRLHKRVSKANLNSGWVLLTIIPSISISWLAVPGNSLRRHGAKILLPSKRNAFISLYSPTTKSTSMAMASCGSDSGAKTLLSNAALALDDQTDIGSGFKKSSLAFLNQLPDVPSFDGGLPPPWSAHGRCWLLGRQDSYVSSSLENGRCQAVWGVGHHVLLCLRHWVPLTASPPAPPWSNPPSLQSCSHQPLEARWGPAWRPVWSSGFWQCWVENLWALSRVLLLLCVHLHVLLRQGLHQLWIWGLRHHLLTKADANRLRNLVRKRSLFRIQTRWGSLSKLSNVNGGFLLHRLRDARCLPMMGAFIVKSERPLHPIHHHSGCRFRAVHRAGVLGPTHEASELGLGSWDQALRANPFTSLRPVHFCIANPVLGLPLVVGTLQKILVVLAPLGDHVALQGPFYTGSGESLALEEVEELRHFLHLQTCEQWCHRPRNMWERFRKAGQLEESITRRFHGHQWMFIRLGSMIISRSTAHRERLDVLCQLIQLDLHLAHCFLLLFLAPFGQEDKLLTVIRLLAQQKVSNQLSIC